MKKISLLSVGILLFLIAEIVIIFWWVYPYKIAEIESPAKVITQQVKRGGTMRYEFKGEVFNNHDVVELRRKLVDGYPLTLDPLYPPTPTKGVKDTIASTDIPSRLFLGKYKVQFEAIHRVNPIRTESIYWETELFEVVE